MVFQGAVFVETSFTMFGRNRSKMDQLDKKGRNDIENILNDEFCSLNVKPKAHGSACIIQNLEFRVWKKISCGVSSNLTNKDFSA